MYTSFFLKKTHDHGINGKPQIVSCFQSYAANKAPSRIRRVLELLLCGLCRQEERERGDTMYVICVICVLAVT